MARGTRNNYLVALLSQQWLLVDLALVGGWKLYSQHAIVNDMLRVAGWRIYCFIMMEPSLFLCRNKRTYCQNPCLNVLMASSSSSSPSSSSSLASSLSLLLLIIIIIITEQQQQHEQQRHSIITYEWAFCGSSRSFGLCLFWATLKLRTGKCAHGKPGWWCWWMIGVKVDMLSQWS